MTPIQQAVEEFREKRLRDYRNDPDRMTRDANSASETAKDHVGRWLYELIQNSDDAGATELLVHICNGAVYVADNGGGLGVDTIKSLSGTHLSVKPAGCIGRKGLGFKSVYSITRTPHIFSRDDGVVFCPDRATVWLRENNLTCTRVPHQWLPFWISRSEAETRDSALADLSSMTTVVQLPLTVGENVEHLVDALVALPSHALLTFRSLRKLKVKAGEKSFEVVVRAPPEVGDVWTVSDSRVAQPCRWQVARATVVPSPEILTEFDDEERRHVEEVSLVVGTPLDERNQVVPASDFLCIHVYYPTEEPSPVRLLLHADLVVKSDRTKVIPLDSSRFNAWVAGKLAELVMDKIEAWYTPLAPASNIKLLLPLPNRSEHPTAAVLWNLLASQAKSRLLLPNTEGKRVLRVQDARVVTTTASRADARVILSGGGFGSRLLLEILERDDEARRVLLELGCQKLSDEDVFSTIKSASSEHANNPDWIWACWRWLAAWLAAKRRSDFTGERFKVLKELPVIPVAGGCVTANALAGKILTWRDACLSSELPDWLPIRFVDDWLRERIFALPDDDPIRSLLADLGIESLNEKLVLKALEKAIATYWSEPNGDPGRFVNLLLARNFHEQYDVSQNLRRCPIYVQVDDETSGPWQEAQFAYFGPEWGESLIADVYEGAKGVAWAKRPKDEVERFKSLLEWLGVTEFPKLIQKNDEDSRQTEFWRISRRVTGNVAFEDVQSALFLDRIIVSKLKQNQARTLMLLLVRYWRYYASHTSFSVSYKYRRSRYSESVPARWWEELKSELAPPLTQNQTQRVSLAKCWLPNHETLKIIGELLPSVDLNCFGDDKVAVEKWLVEAVGVRTRLDQLVREEWRLLLETRIPQLVPENEANRDGKHEKVFDWYEAALESLAAQECQLSVSDSPLLCRKGNQWAYVSRDERWLKDDNELAAVFDTEIWQMTFPSRLHAQAKKFFGLAALSDVRQEAKWDDLTGHEDMALQEQLETVKPYVFIWRCYHTRLDHALLRAKLQRLRVRVADRLEAVVVLSESIPAKVVNKRIAVAGDALMLAQGSTDLPCLAEVLARALDISSESNFFENLLRCVTHGERVRKLEASNCPVEQIERLLVEYRGDERAGKTLPADALDSQRLPQPVSQSPSSSPDGNATSPETGSEQTIEKLSTPETAVISDPVPSTSPKSTTDRSETSQPKSESHSEMSSRETDTTEESTGNHQESAEGLNLKDLRRTAIVVKSQQAEENPTRRRERESSGSSQNDVGDAPSILSTNAQNLSHEQKMAVERRGREFATRKLKELGFDVTPMPTTSPGYDLLAKKAAEILRVEVKAHLGKAKIIDLPIGEFREYARSKVRVDNDRWELWNVEQLGGDSSTAVEITRYAEIPEEAIEAKLLRVDLRQCASV